MQLVAGIDSSTQSCKVVVCDVETGMVVRQGRAPHPPGTEVDPEAWWRALQRAIDEAGGLGDVDAAAVAGQQHGMVALDGRGCVVRPALLWNDSRSAPQADALLRELGGGQAWADAVGVVPVASFTVTKLRWLAEVEPESAARTEAVCLPHDWLTWRLRGCTSIGDLTTDRSDASGTGYWSAQDGYRQDLLELALGRRTHLPAVLGPAECAGRMPTGPVLAVGAGDNAAAALGLGAAAGDVVVSVGTSGVVSSVSDAPVHDGTGLVAGFADATGRFLPLACTLNAALVLDRTAALLGVDAQGLSRLALSAPAGADGLVLVPYLQGERTPPRPAATGALHGMTLRNTTPAHLARAAVEGVLCGLADALDALLAHGPDAQSVLLVGGVAGSPAVRAIAPSILGRPVTVPDPGEYVAVGAARQAAWALSGADDPPLWRSRGGTVHRAEPVPHVRRRYAEARELALQSPPDGR